MIKRFIVWVKKWLPYAIGFLGIVLLSFIIGKCSTRTERTLSRSNLIAARDSVKTSSVTIAGLNNTVYEKNAIILTQAEAIKVGVVERERLKKLHIKEVITNAELEGTIKILRDSLKLVPGTTIITVKDTSGISHDYVKIPFTLLNIKENYVSLTAGMNLNRTAYFDLLVPVSGTMTIGYKRSGFLKTTPTGIFTTDNQYLKVNQMDILIVQDSKGFLSKWWVHALFGGAIVEGIHQSLKK